MSYRPDEGDDRPVGCFAMLVVGVGGLIGAVGFVELLLWWFR